MGVSASRLAPPGTPQRSRNAPEHQRRRRNRAAALLLSLPHGMLASIRRRRQAVQRETRLERRYRTPSSQPPKRCSLRRRARPPLVRHRVLYACPLPSPQVPSSIKGESSSCNPKAGGGNGQYADVSFPTKCHLSSASTPSRCGLGVGLWATSGGGKPHELTTSASSGRSRVARRALRT